ncbi:hypothetical protein GGR52DRAFT_590374 [Hypoxylon sp. FL1284]|nr:hypothetical protein GGR52DRAFT_590374 [Hypoxylon sp. FL1284]
MAFHVYLGLWTNWSRGSIDGATLTLTKTSGNLLIAFVAFYIAFVASRFWRICCLIFHRVYSSPGLGDAVHQQHQIVLRNSATAEAGLLSLARILWAWRAGKKRKLLRPFLTAVFALCSLVAFTVAGGFSSSISTTVGNDVLLKSANCAHILPASNTSDATAWRSLLANKSNNAANYAQQCYGTSKSGLFECNRFVVDSIADISVDSNASCPFDDSICRSTASLRLDSGYVDSNDYLGVNAPENERVVWRYVLHCSPIKTDDYTSRSTHENITWYLYFPGRVVPNFNFRLRHLARPDADVFVVFLSGYGVTFNEPTMDDWYRADIPYSKATLFNENGILSLYHQRDAASPMACTEQVQWCNSAYPRDRGCGPLAGFVDAIYKAAPLFNLTTEDLELDRPVSTSKIGTRLLWAASVLRNNPTSLAQVIQFLGAKSLTSQARLFDGIQYTLAKNQWQNDVINWFSIALASVQQSFVDTVLGTGDQQVPSVRWPPANEHEQQICENQKIRDTAYTSFSFLGICITFGMGILICIISYALEPILEFCHKRGKGNQYAYLEWTNNASLQLHRLANEQPGPGKWYRCTEEVPTADPAISLSCLDITDLKHPVLTRPSSNLNTSAEQRLGGSDRPVSSTSSISWLGDVVQPDEHRSGLEDESIGLGRANIVDLLFINLTHSSTHPFILYVPNFAQVF